MFLWFKKKPTVPVECRNCGFLAIRDSDTLELVSPTVLYRSEGVRGTISSFLPPGMEVTPHCFVGEHSIHNELVELEGASLQLAGEAPGPFRLSTGEGDVTSQFVTSIINKPRLCNAFFTWVDGFSPKEHYEKRESERRREWERRQNRIDRLWRVVELMAFILAGAATAIIAAFIQRGTLFSGG